MKMFRLFYVNCAPPSRTLILQGDRSVRMTTTAPQRKVAFYIRVSTERQAKVEEGSLKIPRLLMRTRMWLLQILRAELVRTLP